MAPIIDAQVHAYERNHPGRPWAGWLHGPAEVTGDDLVRKMDAAGVDGSLLVSPWSMYRYDASYALEVHARHPGRFALIKPFDPESPGIAEALFAWAATPGVVGSRIMLARHSIDSAAHEGLDAILRAGAEHEMPVNILCPGRLPLVRELARRHPDTQIVIDHLGLIQPFEPPAPERPFADLDPVLALAACDNVAIKISGACTLSRKPFPYEDIWDPLRRIFDAYGFERCLWGTDWTRAVGLLSFEQAVEAFRATARLSQAERAMLMGGAAARIYKWRPARAGLAA